MVVCCITRTHTDNNLSQARLTLVHIPKTTDSGNGSYTYFLTDDPGSGVV